MQNPISTSPWYTRATAKHMYISLANGRGNIAVKPTIQCRGSVLHFVAVMCLSLFFNVAVMYCSLCETERWN